MTRRSLAFEHFQHVENLFVCFFSVYTLIMFVIYLVTPSTAKLFNINIHPPEVLSRWRDPQLQVSENYSDLTKWKLHIFK